jgi:peptide/nickel transport system permease protein
VFVAGESRFQRAAMLEVMGSDYIRTARAKGLPRRTVIFKHAMRNAMIPLVTIWAFDFAALLGGSVITETIFSWPGLGPLLLGAINRSDLNLMMGIVLLVSVLVIVFNLIADLLYAVLDPRIRYE